MKFGEFMSYYKKKSENSAKTATCQLSIFAHISTLTSSDSSFQGIPGKLKRAGFNLEVTFFLEFIYKVFFCNFT